VSILLTLASLPVSAMDAPRREGSQEGNDLTTLQDSLVASQVTGTALRVLALALLLPVLAFLFRAVRARNGDHPSFVPVVGVAGIVLVGTAIPLSLAAVRDVAEGFVATGPQTLERAETVLSAARDGGTLRAANIGLAVGNLLFGLWISLTAVEMGRCGLTTRFLAVFGVGSGLATALGIAVGAVLFFGWLGSVALLALGHWPGGRPRAWETGRAIPWDEGRVA
jgi:hypothetical protein